MALKIGARRQETQDEIAHTAHVLKTTFDNMSQGIAVYDADLSLVAFNEKSCDFRGYPPGFVRLGFHTSPTSPANGSLPQKPPIRAIGFAIYATPCAFQRDCPGC